MARLEGNRLILTLSRATTGELVWPRVPAGAQALMLPIHEGFRIPATHTAWRKALAQEYQGINTTENLTLPLVGLDYGDQQLAILFANPFNNRLTFAPKQDGIALTATHSVNRLNQADPYEVAVSLQPGNDWLAAAKAYRSWLKARGELVSLESKLAAVKDGKRLIGASHLYLWGERLLVPQDVKSWPVLRRLMPTDWLKGRAKRRCKRPSWPATATCKTGCWPELSRRWRCAIRVSNWPISKPGARWRPRNWALLSTSQRAGAMAARPR